MDLQAPIDAWRLARAVGVGTVARAAVLRLGARLHANLAERFGARWVPGAKETDRFTRALRVAPSAVTMDDDGARLHTLERHTPGVCARAVKRALAAAAGVEALGRAAAPGEDPRLTWEELRLGRLVVIASGARWADALGRSAEAEHLRRAFVVGTRAFLEAHPPVEGAAAWSSPLEAALRAWNLWVAVSLARPGSLDEATAAGIAASLVTHARFVARRLEDGGLAVGTHLLGELVGLYACGVALGSAGDEPARWRKIARARLPREARRQVLSDGGGAEGATGYARFAFELFVAALACAQAYGEPPPPRVKGAARHMLGFLEAIMGPDGREPGIGDDDGSVVLPPGTRDARDLRPLVPLGAGWLGAPTRPVDVAWSEEAAWIAGVEGARRFEAARAVPPACAFDAPAFGLFVARGGDGAGDMVTLRAGPPGQGGAGGHAHNDALAVTVWRRGCPIVVDPGTGCYLGRRAVRDRFRGVAAHAAVCVGGREPSPLLPTRPFALPDRARARVVASGDDGRRWLRVAEHDGFAALGIAYRREVTFDRSTGGVVIVDALRAARRAASERAHDVVLSFPLGDASAALEEEGIRLTLPDGSEAWLCAGDAFAASWRLEPGAISARYGELAPGLVARRRARVHLPAVFVTRISTGRRTGSGHGG